MALASMPDMMLRGRSGGRKSFLRGHCSCAAQDKEVSPHIAILRIQGPLCFANAARTKERILNLKVRPFLMCSLIVRLAGVHVPTHRDSS